MGQPDAQSDAMSWGPHAVTLYTYSTRSDPTRAWLIGGQTGYLRPPKVGAPDMVLGWPGHLYLAGEPRIEGTAVAICDRL